MREKDDFLTVTDSIKIGYLKIANSTEKGKNDLSENANKIRRV